MSINKQKIVEQIEKMLSETPEYQGEGRGVLHRILGLINSGELDSEKRNCEQLSINQDCIRTA